MELLRRSGDTKGKDDDSRELKRGEFKKILLPLMNHSFPDFDFTQYKNRRYWFQRRIELDSYEVIEGISISFSLKEKLCECSVESCLNEDYFGANAYNTGLVNPHIDLIALKLNKGTLTWEQSSYHHSGRIMKTTEMIDEIIRDLKVHGLKFFGEQRKNIMSNKLLRAGLNAINDYGTLPSKFRVDIEKELRNKNHVVSRIEHPIYVELKEQLQSIEGLSRDLRKEIPRMTYELLELKMAK